MAKKAKNKIGKINLSVAIALFAVFISLLSALISYKEASILEQQQQLMSKEKEASVWPYLENTPYNSFTGDSEALFRFTVTNKGVGPAIIDSVSYAFDGISIKNWELYDEVKKKYPHLLIAQESNAELSNTVLAPGETHKVISIRITKKENDSTTNISDVVNEINDLYVLNYCYCSVYDQCWRVEGYDKISRSEDCAVREAIK